MSSVTSSDKLQEPQLSQKLARMERGDMSDWILSLGERGRKLEL